MNDVKPGVRTSEFWATSIIALGAPLIGVLVAAGVIAPDLEGSLVAFVKAAAPLVGLVVSGIVTARYNDGRVRVKANGG